MKCCYCGGQLTGSRICPSCGKDITIVKRVHTISNYLYNQGLRKAKQHRLTVAIADLHLALKYEKSNIAARNLLGLLYLEIGEPFEAYAQWTISVSERKVNNRANGYLADFNRDRATFDLYRMTVRKYNQVLSYIEQDNFDLALIQIRKVIELNPKMLQAHLLMAVLHMRNGRYDEALKPLQMVAKLDHGNRKSRYYREECSKYVTKDGRLREIRSARARLKKNGKSLLSFLIVSGNPTVQTVVNIMIGIVIGIAVVGFLIVPGVRQHANLNANKSIVSSGETLTSQNSQIKKLQEDLQTAKTAKKDAQKKVKKSEQKSESYEKLLISYDYYKSLSYDKAMSYLEEVDKDSLSADAKKIYDTISEKAGKTVAFTSYAKGNVSYFLKKYLSLIHI